MVNGYNAIQFACDQGTTFWGHFIVDNVALRAVLEPDHPDLDDLELTGFKPTLTTSPVDDEEAIEITLDIPEAHRENITRVVFQGRYFGYDENGSGAWNDWHGFTKEREPQAMLGVIDEPPFAVTWDITRLPARRS